MKTKYKKSIIIELIIIFISITAYIVCHTQLINFMPSCIIYRKFNLLCPSCGATRAIVSISNLNFLNAFYYNSFIFILILYLCVLNTIYIYDTLLNKNLIKYFINKYLYILLFVAIIIFTVIRNILQ